jgi:signal transduction histidine kinase
MKEPPIRLLLVDDNPADALLLTHMLAESNGQLFEVSHVELMSEAVLALAEGSFDAILLDLTLPDSRGIETVEQTNAVAPQVPIVVMTGLDDEATALEAVRRGAQDFLIKGHTDGRLLTRAIRYAVERKHAEQELKALNETLEQRVAERTAVAMHRAAQLQRLASELTLAEHRERRRLAQFLHDHMQQLLYAARLNLDALRRRLQDESLRDMAERIDELLNQSLVESRSLTAQLSLSVLHEAGLVAAFQWLAHYMEQNFRLTVHVESNLRAEPDSEDVRVLLFQSVRELLFNVAKHARVNSACVKITTAANGDIEVVVADEGTGFEPAEPKPEKTAPGLGLFSIRERLELLGGSLRVEAAPGQGARVTVSAPCNGRHCTGEPPSQHRAAERGNGVATILSGH